MPAALVGTLLCACSTAVSWSSPLRLWGDSEREGGWSRDMVEQRQEMADQDASNKLIHRAEGGRENSTIVDSHCEPLLLETHLLTYGLSLPRTVWCLSSFVRFNLNFAIFSGNYQQKHGLLKVVLLGRKRSGWGEEGWLRWGTGRRGGMEEGREGTLWLV